MLVTLCPGAFVTFSVRKFPKLPGVPVTVTVLRCSPLAVCHAPPSLPIPETASAPVPTYERS